MISSRLSSQNNDELRASTFHVRSSGVGGGVNAGAFSFGWSDDIYENRSTSNNSASSSRTGSPTPGFVQSMPAAGGQQPIHNSGKALSTGVAAHMTKALPVDFVLGENDVICGRGSRCFNHIGNQRFRAIVDERLEEYMKTTCKHEKTTIIIDIVKIIRKNSPNGGFVKKDTESGLYYEVGDFLAREKTSQAFRDASEAYKSSNATKKKKRLLENNKLLQKSASVPAALGVKNVGGAAAGPGAGAGAGPGAGVGRRVGFGRPAPVMRSGSKRSLGISSSSGHGDAFGGGMMGGCGRQDSFKFKKCDNTLGGRQDSFRISMHNSRDHVVVEDSCESIINDDSARIVRNIIRSSDQGPNDNLLFRSIDSIDCKNNDSFHSVSSNGLGAPLSSIFDADWLDTSCNDEGNQEPLDAERNVKKGHDDLFNDDPIALQSSSVMTNNMNSFSRQTSCPNLNNKPVEHSAISNNNNIDELNKRHLMGTFPSERDLDAVNRTSKFVFGDNKNSNDGENKSIRSELQQLLLQQQQHHQQLQRQSQQQPMLPRMNQQFQAILSPAGSMACGRPNTLLTRLLQQRIESAYNKNECMANNQRPHLFDNNNMVKGDGMAPQKTTTPSFAGGNNFENNNHNQHVYAPSGGNNNIRNDDNLLFDKLLVFSETCEPPALDDIDADIRYFLEPSDFRI